MKMTCLLREYLAKQEMNLKTLAWSRLASISSSIKKGDFRSSLIPRKTARLARQLSPVERESVPMVKDLAGGMAEKIIPLLKYWNGFSMMKLALACSSQFTNW